MEHKLRRVIEAFPGFSLTARPDGRIDVVISGGANTPASAWR